MLSLFKRLATPAMVSLICVLFAPVGVFGQAASYAETPSIDDEELPASMPQFYFEFSKPFPPLPLVSGNEISITVSVLDANRKPLDVNGTLHLRLMSLTNDSVPFAYTITPSSIPVTDGMASATIVVTSGHDLSKAFLGATFSPNQSLSGVRPRASTIK